MDKEKLISDLAEHIVEGMDMDTLVTFAVEMLEQSYSDYTEDQLITEVQEWAPHLLNS